MASGRPRGLLRGTPGAAVSLTVHGLLIAGAVMATRPGPEAMVMVAVPDTTPIYLDPARPVRETARSVADVPVVPVGPLGGDVLPPFAIPTGIPDADGVVDFGGPLGAPSRPVGWPWAAHGSNASAAIVSARADEAPLLLASPAPDYPPLLRAARIEGTVVTEVVVDTAGAPEADSFRILSSDHPGFAAAARRVVLGARYRPGRWRGRPVRVLIRQPVEFRLAGGGSSPATNRLP